MTCIRCKTKMESEAPRTVKAEVRDVEVSFVVNAPQCPNCAHVAISGRTFRVYTRAASEAYRQHVKLMTASEMELVRTRLKMSREEFAEHLCIGIATYKRWLGGEIQSRAYDKLVRLSTNLECLEATATDLVARLSAGSGAANVTETRASTRPKAQVRNGVFDAALAEDVTRRLDGKRRQGAFFDNGP